MAGNRNGIKAIHVTALSNEDGLRKSKGIKVNLCYRFEQRRWAGKSNGTKANSYIALENLIAEEVHALLSATKAHPLHPYDIIADPKFVLSLYLLHNSMQWLPSLLPQLRDVENSTSAASHSDPTSQTHPRRSTLLTSLEPTHSRSRSAGGADTTLALLPLNNESVITFRQHPLFVPQSGPNRLDYTPHRHQSRRHPSTHPLTTQPDCPTLRRTTTPETRPPFHPQTADSPTGSYLGRLHPPVRWCST